MLWNCEKEEVFIEEVQQKAYDIKERSYSELSKEVKFNKAMDKFLLKKASSKNPDYEFEIDSSKIKEINYVNTTTYTFGIQREIDSLHFFENLVITVDSLENTNAMLFKYIPDGTIETLDHHETFSFQGQAELKILDHHEIFNATNRSDLICFLVSTTYCNATGEGPDGVNYTGTHVAGEACSGFENEQFTVTSEVCFSIGSTVPMFIDVSDGGSGTNGNSNSIYQTGTGGGLPANPNNLPLIITSPTYDYSLQNLISTLGLNSFTENDLISFLQNNLDVALQLHLYLGENPGGELILSATDILRVLSGNAPPGILDSIEEHKKLASIIGNELTIKSSKLFEDINSAFNEIDTDTTLSLSDWELVSAKLQEIYAILPLYDGIVLNDFSQLLPEHQRLIVENSIFSFLLPNIKSLVGEYWPQNAQEWAAIGTILGQFLIELGLAVVPGSGIVDAVGSLNQGEYLAASIALATIAADFFGGTIIKFIGKMGKVIYKTFKIFKVIKKHLLPAIKALNKGLKIVLDNDIVKFVDNLGNEIARIVDNILTFRYAGFGGDIITTPNKTTTVVGKYDVNGVGTRNLIESGLTKQGENIGGFNVLQASTNGLTDDQIWLQINKPWIDDAVARGDVIRVISDPNLQSNLFNNGIPSFFKREIDYLTDPNGYNLTFNPFNNTFE